MLPPCHLYGVTATFSTDSHILVYRENRKEILLYFFKPDKGQIIVIIDVSCLAYLSVYSSNQYIVKMEPSVNHLTTPYRYLKQAKKVDPRFCLQTNIANGFLTTGLEKKFHLGVHDEWIFSLGKYNVHCNFWSTLDLWARECSLYQAVTGKIYHLKQHFLLPASAWRFTRIEEVVLKYHWKVCKFWSDLIKVMNEFMEVY